MNHLLDDDDDLKPQSEREVTLSTAAILGIFFGLVLLCGFFFALGYNLHKPASAIAGTNTAEASTNSTPSAFDRFKPRAGSPDSGSSKAVSPLAKPEVATPPPAAPASAPAAEPAAQPREETPAPAAPAPSPAPSSRNHAEPATPPAPPAPVPVANGAFVVQVAAVSHREDADLLVNALRQKGYTVASRTEPQDKLFHIQVGPFATHKEADQMRQRLLGDGYNAIVK